MQLLRKYSQYLQSMLKPQALSCHIKINISSINFIILKYHKTTCHSKTPSPKTEASTSTSSPHSAISSTSPRAIKTSCSMRSINGDRPRAPSTPDPRISTPPDMPHSVSERSSKNPSTKNISMNMLKDLDSAEDSDSDLIITIYKYIPTQLKRKLWTRLNAHLTYFRFLIVRIFKFFCIKKSKKAQGRHSLAVVTSIIFLASMSYIMSIIINLQRRQVMFQKISLIFLIICLSSALSIHPQAKLDFMDYCKFFKYPVQSHKVVTQDGYILTMFRIQRKGTTIREGLKPIILQHGLLDSSDTWIINDEDKAPGFLLANRGYDIWVGNSRGNKHSRNHTKYNPDKNKEFWEFTFQHMADYDLPAIFTYVNGITKQKISYVGHSQGTIQMHVALSKRNALVENLLDKYFGFGPVAYVQHASSNVVKLLDHKAVVDWYKRRGINEFMPSMKWFETDAGIIFCTEFRKYCDDAIAQLMDADPSLDNYERYDVFIGHVPSGTSLMNMEHWKQCVDRGTFQAYDYGSAQQNKAHYGQATPPLWDIGNIRVPIRLFAGTTDELADPQDVNKMWSLLKPQVKTFLKFYASGHITFLWGMNTSSWMNDLFAMLAS